MAADFSGLRMVGIYKKWIMTGIRIQIYALLRSFTCQKQKRQHEAAKKAPHCRQPAVNYFPSKFSLLESLPQLHHRNAARYPPTHEGETRFCREHPIQIKERKDQQQGDEQPHPRDYMIWLWSAIWGGDVERDQMRLRLLSAEIWGWQLIGFLQQNGGSGHFPPLAPLLLREAGATAAPTTPFDLSPLSVPHPRCSPASLTLSPRRKARHTARPRRDGPPYFTVFLGRTLPERSNGNGSTPVLSPSSCFPCGPSFF